VNYAYFMTWTKAHGLQASGPIPMSDWQEFERTKKHLEAAMRDQGEPGTTGYLSVAWLGEPMP
jgi:hypothetical protein